MRALACALLVAAAPAAAQLTPVRRPARWGAGLTFGDPFGVSVKRYVGDQNAWDLYAAFAYGPGVRFGGDWLWDLGRIVAERDFDVDLYAGVGPFVGALSDPCGPGFLRDRCNGDAYVGGRAPLGAEMLLRRVPLTVGLELAPGVGFAPGRSGFLLDFLLAVRWLF